MKVVVDTNVVISSFWGSAAPKEIIDLWKKGEIVLCISQEIVDEYVEVLVRLKIQENEISELLALLAHYNTLYIHKTVPINVIAADADDNKFLSCAHALGAEYIISGDRHILNVKRFMKVTCITPQDFIDLFSNR